MIITDEGALDKALTVLENTVDEINCNTFYEVINYEYFKQLDVQFLKQYFLK